MANSSDLRSKSLWMDIEVAPDARPLGGDQTCDVVIAGSGIAGISTAYELAVKGLRVMIVDRGRIAGGITARTSAHLAPLCDDLTSEMIKLRGEETSRAFYVSQAAAVDGLNRYNSWKKSRAIFADWMASCSRRWTRTPPSSMRNWTRSAWWARRFTVSLASRRWRGARSSIPCAIRAKQPFTLSSTLQGWPAPSRQREA